MMATLALVASACGGSNPSAAPTTTSSTVPAASSSTMSGSTAVYATTVTSTGRINPAAIPLGDGYVSTSPKLGYVYSCQTSFPSVGGAQAVGPWINTAAKTWDSTAKVHVQGAVAWPAASYSVTESAGQRTIRTADLPINHTTGRFPVAATDPAFTYDRNPNSIKAQSITWVLPENPSAAASPSCTSGGPIGVLDDGVLLFNALDGEGRDAGAHEVLDSCDEHPQMDNQLHHHSVPSCIVAAATGASTLVGYALDGYGIYVERGSDGQLLTNTDLDACHGRTSQVLWNGKEQTEYHYDATLEYPYTVGCFHGTAIASGGGP